MRPATTLKDFKGLANCFTLERIALFIAALVAAR